MNEGGRGEAPWEDLGGDDDALGVTVPLLQVLRACGHSVRNAEDGKDDDLASLCVVVRKGRQLGTSRVCWWWGVS